MRKLLPILPALLLLTACQSAQDFATTETVQVLRPSSTNIVEIVTLHTNQVATTATNSTGEIYVAIGLGVVAVTNLQPIITPSLIVTNLSLSSGVSNGIQGAGKLASNLGVPFADAISGGLVAIAGLVFGWRNRRARRRAEADRDGTSSQLGAAERALGMAKDATAAVVDSFDTLRDAALKVPGYREHDATVMKLVKKAQALTGTRSEIDSIRRSPRIENGKS